MRILCGAETPGPCPGVKKKKKKEGEWRKTVNRLLFRPPLFTDVGKSQCERTGEGESLFIVANEKNLFYFFPLGRDQHVSCKQRKKKKKKRVLAFPL